MTGATEHGPTDTTDVSDVTETINELVAELLANNVSPEVKQRSDINSGFCAYVARTTYQRLNQPDDVSVMVAGGMNFLHRWVRHDGRHYDAERPEGVDDYTELPFFADRVGVSEPEDVTDEPMF